MFLLGSRCASFASSSNTFDALDVLVDAAHGEGTNGKVSSLIALPSGPEPSACVPYKGAKRSHSASKSAAQQNLQTAIYPPPPSTGAISSWRSKRKRKKLNDTIPCKCVYEGNLGAASSFAACAMFNTGRKLLMWYRESDCGLSSVEKSSLLHQIRYFCHITV